MGVNYAQGLRTGRIKKKKTRGDTWKTVNLSETHGSSYIPIDRS
jgi:hypothetical protein